MWVSALSILVPIAAFIVLRINVQRYLWYFFYFLLFAFLVDITSVWLLRNGMTGPIIQIRYLYSLVEPIFYFFLIVKLFNENKDVFPIKILIILLSLLWLVLVPISSLIFGKTYLSIYELVSNVLLSFGTAFIILKYIEEGGHSFFKSEFWIVFGIFFYHFSTFFIVSFLETKIGNSVYVIHNLMNIFTNLIFGFSFFLLYRHESIH